MTMPQSETLISLQTAWIEYLVDAGQRTVLYWDVMRRRGNQYFEHMEKKAPHVLQFDYELIMTGKDLPQPVNYGLVKIRPTEGAETDPTKRPFVVIDPRAGHGPGIGGFKPESEIGVALKAGHPCYFIGFLPMPEEGQTIESVMNAEAAFLECVIERHPQADGKPVIIGNCQAGWAAMMLAATHPDVCGPIIAAGSPLSYWTGVRGENPMRYSGGLLGGSWLTRLTSDMGNGKFDGAWLVQNFEGLNPSNTLWSKQYNLYKKIDTEAARYLGFERWWGGHVVLNAEEIQYIVDNLFVGNKLPFAEVVTADGMRVDFRKIRTPIVCFCSKGDNITPPQQALGWILDLYKNVDDIRGAGQTIVYAVHENIGHLGIFVSGGVSKKEHTEFAENIDLIDCLPPGLYEAVIMEKSDDNENLDLVSNDYISRFEPRTLDDIRALGGNTADDERCFAAVARLSDATNGLYRTLFQPFVQAMATEQSAEWLRNMHPLRLSYELVSDKDPLMQQVETAAAYVKENRQPAAPDNIFLQWQNLFSELTVKSLDFYRDWRDMMSEQMFFGIYSQPWLQAMLGLRATDDLSRRNPGWDPDHRAYVNRRVKERLADIEKGGQKEALIRAVLYVRAPEKAADERGFEMIRRIRKEYTPDVSLDQFKQVIRDQFFMLLLDERRAVDAIPTLLEGHEKDAPELLELVRKVVTASERLGPESEKRLVEIEKLFTVEKPKTSRKKAPKARANSKAIHKSKAVIKATAKTSAKIKA